MEEDNKVVPSQRNERYSRDKQNQRYFNIDENYDRKVYENDWKNMIIIVLVFIVFYSVNVIIFWGLCSLSMAFSRHYMWVSVAMFASNFLFFVGYLIYGRKSN